MWAKEDGNNHPENCHDCQNTSDMNKIRFHFLHTYPFVAVNRIFFLAGIFFLSDFFFFFFFRITTKAIVIQLKTCYREETCYFVISGCGIGILFSFSDRNY